MQVTERTLSTAVRATIPSKVDVARTGWSVAKATTWFQAETVLTSCTAARATTGFAAPINAVDPGYEGLVWSGNFAFVETDEVPAVIGPVGTDNRASSGDNVAFNIAGGDIGFASITDFFGFESMVVGSIVAEAGQFTVQGLVNGQIVVQEGHVMDFDSSQILTFDGAWGQIDEVRITDIVGSGASSTTALSDDTIYIDEITLTFL